MATTELAIELPRKARQRRVLRYFFPSMAGFAFILAFIGFTPEVRRFAAGTFPIPWVLHVHAAIMVSWLSAFALQAWLGATKRTTLHQRSGPYAIAVAWLACASMVFVEYRTNYAHPQLRSPSDLDWKLPGPFVFLTFGAFLAWAAHERGRPQWHKRLMTFALFLSIDAGVQRFLFIPGSRLLAVCSYDGCLPAHPAVRLRPADVQWPLAPRDGARHGAAAVIRGGAVRPLGNCRLAQFRACRGRLDSRLVRSKQRKLRTS